jgi:antitoxin (DNA-binding transcriptional repressor) of toxin-antitoxin stability system
MDILVSQFRAHCLELIRQVEAGGEEVQIRRRSRVVARLSPLPGRAASGPLLLDSHAVRVLLDTHMWL